ncbi:26S proteasome non-ATPase regulatory subunit 9 [Brachionus plicatilis]|uniref:26S proteasome non-ATPase regulatory subunit 9 n=1 Tax=Brachionus plicatilis TaxID=10195 RepID=A0A3M7S837_BRAPC|nr:26S proteasome non-ATPase regulatory subunit 9 [Brachionus plicatilis]
MNTSSHYEFLVQKKADIEDQLNEYNEILIREKNIGMTEELVDKEGYPRSDIDIYKVRLARQQINRLKNDYNSLLVEIEKELINIHSKFNEEDRPGEFVEKTIPLSNEQIIEHRPFAKITQVDPKSPSSEAGLETDDEIIQLGPFTHLNTQKSLAEIGDHVRKSENKIILVKIQRNDNGNESMAANGKKKIIVKLVPKKWSGHGLLGCKIVPID